MSIYVLLLKKLIVHRDCHLGSYTLADSIIIVSISLTALLNYVWVFFDIVVLVVKYFYAGSDWRRATDLAYGYRGLRYFNPMQ